MATFWFLIVALMLVAYVVFDGFDIGAGIVQLFLARDSRERSLIARSVGPVWDGNEVWLLAAGGTLYFAFPLLYASSFSGFYLPLMMVLWLLMMRAIGLEFRHHIHSGLWEAFFDRMFGVASVLLAVFYGAALGNVIRGVPLQPDGYFFEPLWTTFTVTPEAGILDWYTVMAGVVALVTLGVHGAHWVALKTEDELSVRGRNFARLLWILLVLLTPISLAATVYVRPQMLENYRNHPLGLLIPLVVVGSLVMMEVFRSRGRDRAAFLTSAVYIAGMLGGAAFGLYPNVLPASTDPSLGLTIDNTAAAEHGLRVGMAWWFVGILFVIGYFVFVYRTFRGKVTLEEGHY